MAVSGLNTNFIKKLYGASRRGLLVRHTVHEKRLNQLLANSHVRIKACHRILKDHGNVRAANTPKFSLGQGEQILTVKFGSAGVNPPWGLWNQAQERVTRNRFTRTALANDGRDRLGFNREIDVLTASVVPLRVTKLTLKSLTLSRPID